MAIIVITSYGTLGDILPLVALGVALKSQGHQVRMAINESMKSYAFKAGLEAVSNGRLDLGKNEAQKYSQSWNHWFNKGTLSEQFEQNMFSRNRLEYDLTHSVKHLLKVCQDADLLISTPQQNLISAIVHDKIALPWISASVTPDLYCLEKNNSSNTLVKTVSTSEQIASLQLQISEIAQKVRQSIGLTKISPQDWNSYGESKNIILGSSEYFSQPSKKYSHITQTGFWFYEDPEWIDWRPHNELKEFVETTHKLLVLSFSSQPVEKTGSVIAVHVRAAAKLGYRILIQQGWADFNESFLPSDIDRNNVMFTGFMPQDWLFSRAAALIYHGGIGTTARALRNGCPVIVEPYGNDQFFNAKQIVSLKLGTAINPTLTNSDELVRVLRKILTPEYKRRCQTFGAKIRQEQGIDKACNFINEQLFIKKTN